MAHLTLRTLQVLSVTMPTTGSTNHSQHGGAKSTQPTYQRTIIPRFVRVQEEPRPYFRIVLWYVAVLVTSVADHLVPLDPRPPTSAPICRHFRAIPDHRFPAQPQEQESYLQRCFHDYTNYHPGVSGPLARGGFSR